MLAEYVDQYKIAGIEHDVHLGSDLSTEECRLVVYGHQARRALGGSFSAGRHQIQPTSASGRQYPRRLRAVLGSNDPVAPCVGYRKAYESERNPLDRCHGVSFTVVLESYTQVAFASPTASGAQLYNNAVEPDHATSKLDREKVISVDLGYLSQDSDLVNFEITGYFLQVKNLVKLVDTNRIVTPSTPNLAGIDPETGRVVSAFGGWRNSCVTYNSFGGELGARVFPLEGVDVFANYSLNLQSASRAKDCFDVEDQKTSKHKANIGVQVRTKPGIDGEVTFHYSSSQVWAEQQPPTDGSINIVTTSYNVPAFTLLNARVGYRFLKNSTEVSATAFNLLNDKHREHPLGQMVGRRFMGFLSYKF
ncbi:MAG: TonB-dependent receptor [Polyangiaceae bacterium]